MRFGKYYSIGEVAKLKGLTIKTLRYYDEVGLFKPAYVNPESGYRYYTVDQLFDIEFIMMLRDSGTPINEILKAHSTGNSLDYANMLMGEIEKIEMKILKLQDTIDKFRQMIAGIYYSKARSVNLAPYSRYLKSRTVVRRPCVTEPTAPETYDIFFDVYSYIRKHELSTIYETGAVVDFDLISGTFAYREMYVEAKKTQFSSECVLSRFPAGNYLCINYFKDNREEQLRKLADELRRQNLHPRLAIQADMYLEVTDYSNPLLELRVLI